VDKFKESTTRNYNFNKVTEVPIGMLAAINALDDYWDDY